MKNVLLDSNIYDKLYEDEIRRRSISDLINQHSIRIIATPMIVDELRDSPFKGLPDWFPIDLECENVSIVGFARVGMTRVGEGDVYTRHRGESNKIKDGIIADSADSLSDIFVSEDRRCRRRLTEFKSRCIAMTYDEFCHWTDGLLNNSEILM